MVWYVMGLLTVTPHKWMIGATPYPGTCHGGWRIRWFFQKVVLNIYVVPGFTFWGAPGDSPQVLQLKPPTSCN